MTWLRWRRSRQIGWSYYFFHWSNRLFWTGAGEWFVGSPGPRYETEQG